MIDPTKLIEVSMLELEVGFRKMKEKLDKLNVDYKVLLFEIDTENEYSQEEDGDRDAEDVKKILAEQSISAIPLMKEEFTHKVNREILKDQLMAEKIALGCQQVARSVCFVHFWAFNALWVKFNSDQGDGKRDTMKALLAKVAAEKQ